MELLIHRWRGPPSLTREGLVTAHRSFCAPSAVCGNRLDGQTVFTPTGVCKAIETGRRGADPYRVCAFVPVNVRRDGTL